MTTQSNDDLTSRLENCYTGAVFDVLRANGYPKQVLPREIKALLPEQRLAGPIFTVQGESRTDIGEHESLLEWTRMLTKAPSGHVVICQPNDDVVAHMGELSSETFIYRGVRGYIVDGGARDTDFISKIGFQVFSKYTTPMDVVGRWLPTEYNQPITIGGVVINGGDYVLADRDGVVIIPGDIVEDIVSKVEVCMNTENKVRTAILDGMAPDEAYLKYGKF